jgi:hypothetical protein
LALETNCLGCIARVTYQDKFSNADLWKQMNWETKEIRQTAQGVALESAVTRKCDWSNSGDWVINTEWRNRALQEMFWMRGWEYRFGSDLFCLLKQANKHRLTKHIELNMFYTMYIKHNDIYWCMNRRRRFCSYEFWEFKTKLKLFCMPNSNFCHFLSFLFSVFWLSCPIMGGG